MSMTDTNLYPEFGPFPEIDLKYFPQWVELYSEAANSDRRFKWQFSGLAAFNIIAAILFGVVVNPIAVIPFLLMFVVNLQKVKELRSREADNRAAVQRYRDAIAHLESQVTA